MTAHQTGSPAAAGPQGQQWHVAVERTLALVCGNMIVSPRMLVLYPPACSVKEETSITAWDELSVLEGVCRPSVNGGAGRYGAPVCVRRWMLPRRVSRVFLDYTCSVTWVGGNVSWSVAGLTRREPGLVRRCNGAKMVGG